MPYGDPLYADELIDTLTEIKQRRMFENLVFFMEACESGSMFEDLLPEDTDVCGASSSSEPSYANLWDSDRRV